MSALTTNRYFFLPPALLSGYLSPRERSRSPLGSNTDDKESMHGRRRRTTARGCDLKAVQYKLAAIEKGQQHILIQYEILAKENATQKALITYLKKSLEDVHQREDVRDLIISQQNDRLNKLEQASVSNAVPPPQTSDKGLATPQSTSMHINPASGVAHLTKQPRRQININAPRLSSKFSRVKPMVTAQLDNQQPTVSDPLRQTRKRVLVRRKRPYQQVATRVSSALKHTAACASAHANQTTHQFRIRTSSALGLSQLLQVSKLRKNLT